MSRQIAYRVRPADDDCWSEFNVYERSPLWAKFRSPAVGDVLELDDGTRYVVTPSPASLLPPAG